MLEDAISWGNWFYSKSYYFVELNFIIQIRLGTRMRLSQLDLDS